MPQPATGVGSVAETNALLGGNYFDTNTGAQLKTFVPTPVAGVTQTNTPAKTPAGSAGTMTANITTPVSTQTKSPAVITSAPAKVDLANKQTQVTQLNADTQNHQNAVATSAPTPPTTPTATTKQTTTPATTGGSLDSQISDLISGLNTSSDKIQSDANTSENQIMDAQAKAQADQNAAYAQTAQRLNDISSGVYPLSPYEQNLLQATTNQFNSVIAAQQTANQAYTGQMTELMASLGINTSAPTQAIGMIQATINSGNSKIADLNSKMAISLGNLQQGFAKQDFDMVQQNWNDAAKQFDDRQATLKSMLDSVTTQAKAATDELNTRTTMALTSIMDQNTISYQDKQLALSRAQLDETTRHDLATELANDPGSPQYQDKLYQQGVSDLRSEMSNRSGGLGLQDAKVNQAIHLKALFDQYKKTVTVPNTGTFGEVAPGTHTVTTYDIPPSAYTELAIGVANLVSGSNTVAEGTVNSIKQATAKGDIGKALTYATGQPFNGSTQAVFNQLKDSVDRQALTAEGERQTYVNDLVERLPPGLSPDNTQRLIQSSGLNSYYTPKEQVNNYIQSNPAQAESVAKLYEQNFTDEQIAEYLNLAQ